MEVRYHTNPFTLETNQVEMIEMSWNAKWRGRVVGSGVEIEDDNFNFTKEAPSPILEQLEHAIRIHDLTFSFSDQGSTWKRGMDQLERIKKLAKFYPADATRLWKEKVDKTLRPQDREQFYREFF